MNKEAIAIWQRLMLSHLRLELWHEGSYLYRWVGLLQGWRQSSWLMQYADLIGVLLVSLVLGLAPFVSTSLIGVLLMACGGFWVIVTLSDEVTDSDEQAPQTETNSLLSQFSSIHLLVLLYWAIATVATALSPVKTAAFAGWIKLTLYLLLFTLSARLLRKPPLRDWLISVYLHVSLIVSVYGLRQWFFGADALATWTDPTSASANTTRVYSYLGNPNLLAGYLLPGVIFSLAAAFVWRSWMQKLLALTMFGCTSACLVLTFSRGGWIGFVVGITTFSILLVYWLSVKMPPLWRKLSMPIFLGSLAGLFLFAVMFVEPVRDRFLTIFAGRRDSSNNFRLNVWAAAIDMIKARPVLGIGPGNDAFNKIYPLFQRPRYTALSAYSVILEVAVEVGLIGLSAFLWLLGVTFNRGLMHLNRLRELGRREGFWLMGAIATLLGMMAHGAVDTVWYRPQVNTLWWLVVALIASYSTISFEEKHPSQQR